MTILPVVYLDPNEIMDSRNNPYVHYMRRVFDIQSDPMPVDIGFDIKGERKYAERKKIPSDFVASITDNRLKTQIPFLSEHSGWLLLEGEFKYTHDGHLLLGVRHGKPTTGTWTIAHINGMLDAIQDAGVRIMYSPGPLHTPMVIQEMITRAKKEGEPTFINKRKKPKWAWGKPMQYEEVAHAFQGFGIGPKDTEIVWEHCRTLRDFACMSEDELKAIPRIGPTKAEKMSTILDLPWKDFKNAGAN